MANYVPFSGAIGEAGGFLLPEEQGGFLVNGILRETGALQLAGDARATSARKTNFNIWLGLPTADFVGEGGRKPVTGGEFGSATMNIQKIASIVMFTDEMLEDVQGGDLNPLVDAGVREAISQVIDADAIGMEQGTAYNTRFNSSFNQSTSSVEYDQTLPDGLERAVSAAMGMLEANGYGNTAQMGVLLSTGWNQMLRDASSTVDPTVRVYDEGRDPLYGIQRASSSNLTSPIAPVGAGGVVGVVVHRPNLHVRIRKDIEVRTSTEATIQVDPADPTTTRSLFQEDLTAVRYETRLGFYIHDLDAAVVKIINAA